MAVVNGNPGLAVLVDPRVLAGAPPLAGYVGFPKFVPWAEQGDAISYVLSENVHNFEDIGVVPVVRFLTLLEPVDGRIYRVPESLSVSVWLPK